MISNWVFWNTVHYQIASRTVDAIGTLTFLDVPVQLSPIFNLSETTNCTISSMDGFCTFKMLDVKLRQIVRDATSSLAG